MSNRVLKSAWLLALCLPTLALAQEEFGKGTVEVSVGGGIKIQDTSLNQFLASGRPNTRFTNSASPSGAMPALAARLGYNFTRNLAFSIGGEVASGSGVMNLTPLAGLTITSNLNKRTNSFMTIGTQATRVVGNNGRRIHPTWGANLSGGVRRRIGETLALRLEAGFASEHYAELPDAKAAYPVVGTIGLSWFTNGRRPRGQPAP